MIAHIAPVIPATAAWVTYSVGMIFGFLPWALRRWGGSAH